MQAFINFFGFSPYNQVLMLLKPLCNGCRCLTLRQSLRLFLWCSVMETKKFYYDLWADRERLQIHIEDIFFKHLNHFIGQIYYIFLVTLVHWHQSSHIKETRAKKERVESNNAQGSFLYRLPDFVCSLN